MEENNELMTSKEEIEQFSDKEKFDYEALFPTKGGMVEALRNKVWNFPTMTPEKINKISDRMVEMDRANQTLGRSETQTSNQLMTLSMLTDSPYRRLRQCLTQIERRRQTIEMTYWEDLKHQKQLEEWREENTEETRAYLAEHYYMEQRNVPYIEGTLKEIAIFQEAYEEIRKNNNIPEDWDEEDAEIDEIRHHLRQAFRQAHRDMTLTGSITQGNAEYLEQYGIHLQTAKHVIGEYIRACNTMIEEGRPPNITHLYEFLDYCVDSFGNEFHHVLKHIGLDGLIKQDYLYRSQRDLGDIGKGAGSKKAEPNPKTSN